MPELEAQVAELQAQVDAYHLKEIVASFDGGEVSLEDAESLYENLRDHVRPVAL